MELLQAVGFHSMEEAEIIRLGIEICTATDVCRKKRMRSAFSRDDCTGPVPDGEHDAVNPDHGRFCAGGCAVSVHPEVSDRRHHHVQPEGIQPETYDMKRRSMQ